jgi:hypothetical protein
MVVTKAMGTGCGEKEGQAMGTGCKNRQCELVVGKAVITDNGN